MPTTADINYIEDKNGDVFFPVTHVGAVIDDDNNALNSILAGKQDTLTAGTNVTISNNVISATGAKGDDGVGISSVVQTTESTVSGGTNVITITKTDGTSSTVNVRNGDAVGSATIVQSTGTATDAVMSQDAVSKELAEIGRKTFGPYDVWETGNTNLVARSKYTYDVDNAPVIDQVCYKITSGFSDNPPFLVITPNDNFNYSTNNDCVAIITSGFGFALVVKREGTVLVNQALNLELQQTRVIAVRIDFRAKQFKLVARRLLSNQADLTYTYDLSAYDLSMGDCYIFSGLTRCGRCVNTIVGINAHPVDDLTEYLDKMPVCGAYKMFKEYLSGGMTTGNADTGQPTYQNGMMFINNVNQTKVEAGHYRGTINTSVNVKMQLYPGAVFDAGYDQKELHFLIKPSDGNMTISDSTNAIMKIYSIWDTTASAYVTPVDGVYTLTDGHTYRVVTLGCINYSTYGFYVTGTCTIDVWGQETRYMMLSNLTPINYDGVNIDGNIPFLFNYPSSPVAEAPMFANNLNNSWVAGRVRSNGTNLYYSMDNNGYIIEKQINNS